MSSINLLPWRQALREQLKKDVIIVTAIAVICTLIIIFFIHLHIDSLLDNQTQRNNLLKDEVAFVDRRIVDINGIEEKKADLLARIDVIQQLQASRPEVVHLFDEIPKAMPTGIFLTKITQKGIDITLDGKSTSNVQISAFMHAIEASPWLDIPKLDIIKSTEKEKTEKEKYEFDQINDFTLEARQLNKANPPIDKSFAINKKTKAAPKAPKATGGEDL